MRNLPQVLWLPWLLFAATIGLGLFFRRRAPAVALGLLGALVGGLVEVHGNVDPTTWADVPLVGLLVLGVVGLVFTPRASPRFLMGASGIALVGGAVAVAVNLSFFGWACPSSGFPLGLEMRYRHWCNGVSDAIPVVRSTFFVIAAAGILAVLFLVSAWRASRRDGEDPLSNARTRRLVGLTVSVMALVAVGFIMHETPRPPHIDASVVPDGDWTQDQCRFVPRLPVLGGAHKRCLAGAGSAAFTVTFHNSELSDVDVGCTVRAVDAGGNVIGPMAYPPVYIPHRALYGGLLLHADESKAFSWFVNGVSSSSISSYVASCDGYYDPGP